MVYKLRWTALCPVKPQVPPSAAVGFVVGQELCTSVLSCRIAEYVNGVCCSPWGRLEVGGGADDPWGTGLLATTFLSLFSACKSL